MNKNIEQLLNCISPDLRNELKKCDNNLWDKAEEIRLTAGKPVMICYNGGFEFLCTGKKLIICNQKDIDKTILLLTDNSLYSANDSLCKGFITVKGGNRAGITGTTVIKEGKISTVKEISSINLRIKREIKNVAEGVIEHIVSNKTIKNTLVISPPQCGKTTLLRDISRLLGNGCKISDAYKVSLVDERGEIAGMYNGIPSNDVGIRTTVLNLCPKSIGIPFVVRSMSPDVIITDEIGNPHDAKAINYAACSGVKIITSAHGLDIKDLINKQYFKSILKFFDLFIILDAKKRGCVKSIVRREDVTL